MWWGGGGGGVGGVGGGEVGGGGGGGGDGPGEWLDRVGKERVLCVCARVKDLVKDG